MSSILTASSDAEDIFDFIQAAAPQGARRNGKRNSVSAEAFGEWNKRKAFEPPVHEKTPDQMDELTSILTGAFLFSSLEPKDMEVVVNAMKGPIHLEVGNQIIKEGDNGEVVYVVTDGSLDCFKAAEGGTSNKVGVCGKGDLFGELALMYNCPRSASVICGEEATVWELDRETFNSIVMEAVQRKRKMCRSALQSVPLFEDVPKVDLENIIDALKVVKHPAETTVITQGEVGEHFYIVYEGRLVATKVEEGTDPKTFVHEAGDFFGELALIRNEPRAATVVADTDCRLFAMDGATFERLMGPAKDFLKRGAARYE